MAFTPPCSLMVVSSTSSQLVQKSNEFLAETSGLSTFDTSLDSIAKNVVEDTFRQAFEANQEVFNDTGDEDLEKVDDTQSNNVSVQESLIEEQSNQENKNGIIASFRAFSEADLLSTEPEENIFDIEA